MSKTIRYLGLAKKAGKLVAGSDTCEMAMKKGKVHLLIITGDTSPNSTNKAVAAAEKYGVMWLKFGTSEEIGHGTGSPGKHIYAITDEGFANTISESFAQELNEVGNEEVSGCL